MLTQEFAKKLKDKLKKSNGVNRLRLPRRKYVPRNPLLHFSTIKSNENHYQELEEGEIPRVTFDIRPVQNPLSSLMTQISTLDQPLIEPPEQIKNEINNSNTPPSAEFSPTSIVKEEITVTPDVNLLSQTDIIDTPTCYDNQISLKRIRATSFPCPLCPMEATQGHIRFHLHSVHGQLLRDFDRTHKCLICYNQVKSKDILSHSLSHDISAKFDCNFCDESYFYKIKLENHLEKIHQTYSCDFCEMSFYSRKGWKSHTTTKLHKMKKFAKEELKKQGVCTGKL